MTREVAINVLKSHYHKNPRTSYSFMVKQATEMAIEALRERKTGKWIKDGHHIRCNNCDEYMCEADREGDKIPTNFCPNCGAKMEVDE